MRPGNFWERYRLIASLLLFLVPPPVFSQCQFTLARLKYGGGGDWYNGPSALPNLAKAVKEQTPIPICDTTAVIAVMDENFFHYPFIYMTGHGNVHFTPAERVRLRTYLIGGGVSYSPMMIMAWTLLSTVKCGRFFRRTHWLQSRQIILFIPASTNYRDCRRSMSMTVYPRRDLGFFSKIGWLFIMPTAPISVMAWKTKRSIMTARSSTDWH